MQSVEIEEGTREKPNGGNDLTRYVDEKRKHLAACNDQRVKKI